jgi:hypothetical protein
VDGLFDKIDPQVVFVIVALVIGALQALFEKYRRKRAERELAETEDRPDEAVEGETGGAKGTFRELYEEYRRSLLPGSGDEDSGSAPPVPPPPDPGALSRPAPPPLPGGSRPPIKAAPASWQPPKIKRAEERLSAAERAALDAVRARGRRKKGRRVRSPDTPPVRRLLATPASLRTAVVLREILGPPKGLP